MYMGYCRGGPLDRHYLVHSAPTYYTYYSDISEFNVLGESVAKEALVSSVKTRYIWVWQIPHEDSYWEYIE